MAVQYDSACLSLLVISSAIVSCRQEWHNKHLSTEQQLLPGRHVLGSHFMQIQFLQTAADYAGWVSC
jgi:hypothetical protein